MFVILTYDVHQKRVGKIFKTCRRYLHAVQRSVFEGTLTEGQIERMKKELAACIDPHYDAVSIYVLGSIKYAQRHELGISRSFDGVL